MGPGADAAEIPYHLNGKFVATGSGRNVSDMQQFRDSVWGQDPRTFIGSHTNWSGTRNTAWISGFGSGGGSINGWYTPNNALPDLAVRAYMVSGPRSQHEGGVMVGLADGSVRFVTDSIDLELYRGLWTVRGREVQTEF